MQQQCGREKKKGEGKKERRFYIFIAAHFPKRKKKKEKEVEKAFHPSLWGGGKGKEDRDPSPLFLISPWAQKKKEKGGGSEKKDR